MHRTTRPRGEFADVTRMRGRGRAARRGRGEDTEAERMLWRGRDQKGVGEGRQGAANPGAGRAR